LKAIYSAVEEGTSDAVASDAVTSLRSTRCGAGRRHATPALTPSHPEEIAAVALLLASDELPYMTGAQLVMDGGKTAHAG